MEEVLLMSNLPLASIVQVASIDVRRRHMITQHANMCC